VQIIGGGLAGSEAAWQLAQRGVSVDLYEMRPQKKTEAHASDSLAELVCSNSFRSLSLTTGAGLLKEEMRRLGSLIIRIGEENRVPAGSALAVDRDQFAAAVTDELRRLPQVRVIREEVETVPPGPVILATGPLTSPSLSAHLSSLLGSQHLYFYDAISPIVTAESIDMDVAFRASRYDSGTGDYLNLPLNREEYYDLVDCLLNADKIPTRSFERFIVFEGCQPIEEIARRGHDSLAFGPMKPTGLMDPRTGKRPFAVIQLRQENREQTLYNMVGFQTKMTYPEQKRVFSRIPGLGGAEFVRLGSLHRNTFIDSPRHLHPTLQWKHRSDCFFAGQITGVEGYIESAATGLLAGLNGARLVLGMAPVVPPATTALGSLLRYVSDDSRKNFQPMNSNFGILPQLSSPARGKVKKELMSKRALKDLEVWKSTVLGVPAPRQAGLA
jgi:methylenetetrahydrofolate--tRNA-(uracil-5-)-methyltransferase